MSVVLDPSKDFVTISVLYIESKTKHGNSLFHFIRSAEDMEKWKSEGYITIAELEKIRQQESEESSPVARQPGAAITPKAKYDPKKIIESIETSWKRLTWKDHNILAARSIKQVPDGKGGFSNIFDGITYKDLKLKMCLKRWNIKDKDGSILPVDENMIDNLASEVGMELLDTFEKITEISVEELKN